MVLTIDLPNWMIKEIDELAKETELSRSEVIKEMLDYVLDDEELLDEIFPPEAEE